MRQNEEARRIQAEEHDYEQILAQGLRPYNVADDAQEVRGASLMNICSPTSPALCIPAPV